MRDFLAVKAVRASLPLAGFKLSKTATSDYGSVSRGICRSDSAGYLIDVQEHTRIERDGGHGARTMDKLGNWNPIATNSIASMNLWGFDPPVMKHLESLFRGFLADEEGDLKSEFFIPSAVDAMIKEGKTRCKVLKTDEQWFGVTYRADRELAAAAIRSLISEGIYPAQLCDHAATSIKAEFMLPTVNQRL